MDLSNLYEQGAGKAVAANVRAAAAFVLFNLFSSQKFS